jgi:hypothetical protein
MVSDLDVLHMHGKLRGYDFQCNQSHGVLKSESPAIIKTRSFSYISCLFSIWSLGQPCPKSAAQDAYDLKFGHSSYATKDGNKISSAISFMVNLNQSRPQSSKQNRYPVPKSMQYFLSIKHSCHNSSSLFHSSMHDLIIPCILYMLPYLLFLAFS